MWEIGGNGLIFYSNNTIQYPNALVHESKLGFQYCQIYTSIMHKGVYKKAELYQTKCMGENITGESMYN